MYKDLETIMAPYLGGHFFLLPNYWRLFVLGLFVAIAWTIKRLERIGLTNEQISTAVLSGVVGAGLGAISFSYLLRLFYGGALEFGKIGVSSLGALAGATAGVYFIMHREEFLRAADVASAPAAFGLAIVRIGCLLGGCCFGRVQYASPVIDFPAGSPAHTAHVRAGLVGANSLRSLPVVPTQLYEAVMYGAIGVILLLVGQGTRPGKQVAILMIGLAGIRFTIEFWRASFLPVFLGFSPQQLICLVMGLIGILLLVEPFQSEEL